MNYKNSGVDTQLADALVKHLGISGYGAVIPVGNEKIVLSTDGVGTKILVAEAQNKFDTIGIDLVAMCTNDILCQGARPHSFLDYYATGKLDLKKSKQILKGIQKGCELAGCTLVGGETAEMPGVYEGTNFDLAGFAMGIVQSDRPKEVKPGDLLIGIPSSGPHSNGYSLLRNLLPLEDIPLTPTRIYTNEILNNLDSIKALSHITGGGLHGNIPRVLNGKKFALKDTDWFYTDIIQMPGWWEQLYKKSKLSKHEFQCVFNCGWGMVLVVEHEQLDNIDIPYATVIGEVL